MSITDSKQATEAIFESVERILQDLPTPTLRARALEDAISRLHERRAQIVLVIAAEEEAEWIDDDDDETEWDEEPVDDDAGDESELELDDDD